MASGKEADSTKSTTFRLLWGSLHFGGRRGRPATGNPTKIEDLRNGFRKRSGLCEIDNFAAFVGFPSFRRPPATGNPENPGGLRTLWGVI